ncbi:structural constituent of ribosome [Raphanus sativus]|uniref:Plant UBX domain-containing protein 14 n=1 Tax=Raphanus sativus TaxID=3726 RepID=A0A9W3DG48_RAPSA|nr:putative plant UBX domain-containing protein 14 [Raphanus sativus]KAJ4904521.1 structural constituent of ribosome [Raphanus sativus]
MRDDQQKLISSFMEIAIGQNIETAIQFLVATSWNLEEAINLFLTHSQNQPLCQQNATEQYWSDYQEEEKHIPPPLPSVRDTLYDYYTSSINQTPVQVCPEKIWDAESEPSDSDTSVEPDSKPEPSEESRSLSSLYRAPLKLLFQGTFEEAKSASSTQNLWLLVNLQSTTEFASHMLNRDLWANEVVSQAIESSFMLSQVYDDTTQGQKISSFYRIESSPPVVLLIDPITGQKMRSWSGVIEPHGFVEDLMKYMDDGPHEYMASLPRNKRLCSESSQIGMPKLAESLEETKEGETCCSSNQTISHIVAPSWGPEFEKSAEVKKQDETCLRYPDLTEEPKGECDKSVVCSVCVRFPDGRRKQRKFFKTEPIQLLWAFCYSQMLESEKKAFKLVQAIPGASKTLEYGDNATFDQSGLANSMISVTWE